MAQVNSDGCALSDLDTDEDGVTDDIDLCPFTPLGETPDANGCIYAQLDDDNDGIENGNDFCPDTEPGTKIDQTGCPGDEVQIPLVPPLGYLVLAALLVVTAAGRHRGRRKTCD